jgi:hypothetical protein
MNPQDHENGSKHPDVLAWNQWLNSEEGATCSKPFIGTLERQYLENRLYRAFMAGRKKDDEIVSPNDRTEPREAV